MDQMDSTSPDDWRYGLWSALSLEFLAKAALANVSPLLLADPHKWQNLLYAIGRDPTERKFTPKSIGAMEVIARLGDLIPEFNPELAGFCKTHIARRNAELHSGEAAFYGLGTSAWLPWFYKACKVLLEALGRDLGDFFSAPEQADDMIASLNDAAAKAVEKEIEDRKQAWFERSEEERHVYHQQATSWASSRDGHRVECPACSSPALLYGHPTGPVSRSVGPDLVEERQSMLPSVFECVACGLKIVGYSKLSACGLGDVFNSKTSYTAANFFGLYTEDELEQARSEIPDFEPDFNE